MKRRYVFCDLHGTLVERSLNHLALTHLGHMLNVQPETIRHEYERHEGDWDLGHIDEATFWRRVIVGLGAKVTDDAVAECRETVRACLTRLPWATDLMDKLDSYGTVVIVSNTKRELVDHLKARYFRTFGDSVLWATSYDLGARKPTPLYVTRLLMLMGKQLYEATVAETVGLLGGSYWVDDDAEALQMAAANGFTPISAPTPRIALRHIEEIELAVALGRAGAVAQNAPRAENP